MVSVERRYNQQIGSFFLKKFLFIGKAKRTVYAELTAVRVEFFLVNIAECDEFILFFSFIHQSAVRFGSAPPAAEHGDGKNLFLHI